MKVTRTIKTPNAVEILDIMVGMMNEMMYSAEDKVWYWSVPTFVFGAMVDLKTPVSLIDHKFHIMDIAVDSINDGVNEVILFTKED